MTLKGRSATADLLARFPKARPALPPRFQEIYAAQYKENRSGESKAASLSQRLESWMHRQVAADVAGRTDGGGSTLELGAGTLNQLPFEPACAAYDVVEPFSELFAGSPRLARVREVFSDIGEIPAGRGYDRITSVAALEHICDLPLVLARSAGLLNPGGAFRAAIPSEGGLLWGIGWRLTTGLEFRLRHGLEYKVMMDHEHVNTAREIEALVRMLFEEVEVRACGLGRHLSIYRFIAARRPRPEIAARWEAAFSPAA